MTEQQSNISFLLRHLTTNWLSPKYSQWAGPRAGNEISGFWLEICHLNTIKIMNINNGAINSTAPAPGIPRRYLYFTKNRTHLIIWRFSALRISALDSISVWRQQLYKQQKNSVCLDVCSEWILETLSFVNCVRGWDSQRNNFVSSTGQPVFQSTCLVSKARYMQAVSYGDPCCVCFPPSREPDQHSPRISVSHEHATSAWTEQVPEKRVSIFSRTPWMKEGSTWL